MGGGEDSSQPTRQHAHTPDTSRPACVAIALGSNLGDRAAYLNAALGALAQVPRSRVLAVSTFHETPAWGPVPQPGYLNAACLLETRLPPLELLAHLQDIERSQGRDRSREERFGPRTLDLDLVLFGDLTLDVPFLVIPHPRMHERRFVLAPLAEIAPDAVHPVLHRSVREMLEVLPST
jgi:2-amino-4-hydroxy-6-hydroxymethyldihydropteridine diphosphokinase